MAGVPPCSLFWSGAMRIASRSARRSMTGRRSGPTGTWWPSPAWVTRRRSKSPPTMLARSSTGRLPRPDALYLGWFRPIGVSALFYLTVEAERMGANETVLAAGSLVLAASTVVFRCHRGRRARPVSPRHRTAGTVCPAALITGRAPCRRAEPSRNSQVPTVWVDSEKNITLPAVKNTATSTSLTIEALSYRLSITICSPPNRQVQRRLGGRRDRQPSPGGYPVTPGYA